MIKIDLARALAGKLEISLKDAEDYLTTLIEVIGETMEQGEKVHLAGFGNFGLRYVPEHQGRNPKTGESLTVPAGYYPIFKAGKGLKDSVAKCQRVIDEDPTDTQPEPPETDGPKPKRAPKKKKTDEPAESGLQEASWKA